jgi:hypothetical protein
MRRFLMMLAMVMLIAVMAVGVAVAVTATKTKTCGDNLPCRGTDNDDVLYEREGNREKDRILGLDRNDDMDAALFTRDKDRLDGGRGRDRILVNDGDGRDSARGGRGRDVCFVDRGDGRRSCERVEVAAAGFKPAGFGDTAPDRGNELTDPGETTDQE